MHLRGLHVPQDFGAARRHFAEAARRGLPAGHNGLGVLAFNGQGGPANATAALGHFAAGARAGDPDCLYNIGARGLWGFMEGSGRRWSMGLGRLGP